ncbi:MAG: hypothetical protein M5U34_19460 [Chloroflexi bacterium]|nr:hypothetical protein [Chloroflexota bacterium]
MTYIKSSKKRFAICIDNSNYPASLELHKVYRVIPDDAAAKDGDLRVIDESGEDYLFSAQRFLLVDFSVDIANILASTYSPVVS